MDNQRNNRCTLTTPEKQGIRQDLLLDTDNCTYWAKNYYRPEDFSASLLQQPS